MRFLKKIGIMAGVMLLIGGTSIALATMPKPKAISKEAIVKQASESKPVQPASPIEQAPTEVLRQPTSNSKPTPVATPEQVKAEALDRIINYATSRGWNVEAQRHCAEGSYNSFIGYTDKFF